MNNSCMQTLKKVKANTKSKVRVQLLKLDQAYSFKNNNKKILYSMNYDKNTSIEDNLEDFLFPMNNSNISSNNTIYVLESYLDNEEDDF